VLLCTDGDFNVGPSTTTELVAMIEAKRKSGITLTVLGFGSGNLNDEMMEAISNKGNGIYGVISSQEHADRYVSERMLSTIVHIAKDVKIQVEFNPARVYAYRLLGYENRAIADQDFRDDIVDAGEIGAGHRVTALYEVVPAGATVPERSGAPTLVNGAAADGAIEVAANDLVLVKVRYKTPNATETDPAREVHASLPAEALAAPGVADRDTQWAVAIAALAEILKGSPYAEPAAMPQIAAIVAADAPRDADRSELAVLLARARTLLGN
jgi:Ca-activated chloride channel family protein